ncbi:Scr1 family TA system antitoxin-like transcriptional regulator [Streptomyces sp. NPDC059076]|uniref:helix-turn-helix domain-containing protein n=1 Tax=unclassified Streptomyces TaxID=2593676 RepID=UPI0036A310C0
MSEYTSNELNEPQDGAAFLGMEVKSAREFVGMTQQQLADATHYKRPYVTKVEGGTLLASENFAEACDRIFERPGSFARLRRRVSERGHAGWFIPYVKLEQEALAVTDYSNAFIMGMLQTREYAEAVFRSAFPRETDEQINGRVMARLCRREVLDREDPPLLWVILHESVLHTVVGDRRVMADQLRHLMAEVESPHITIQVLPYDAGAPASNLPFNLLMQVDGATVVYSETFGRGQVNDSTDVVTRAQATYDRLRADALSSERSMALIHKIMEEHLK